MGVVDRGGSVGDGNEMVKSGGRMDGNKMGEMVVG